MRIKQPLHSCAVCGSVADVQEDMCAECYEAMPMDEWVSVTKLQHITHSHNTSLRGN